MFMRKMKMFSNLWFPFLEHDLLKEVLGEKWNDSAKDKDEKVLLK